MKLRSSIVFLFLAHRNGFVGYSANVERLQAHSKGVAEEYWIWLKVVRKNDTHMIRSNAELAMQQKLSVRHRFLHHILQAKYHLINS